MYFKLTKLDLRHELTKLDCVKKCEVSDASNCAQGYIIKTFLFVPARDEMPRFQL